MTTEQVLVEVAGDPAGDLATVTLNRPDRRNALSESMLRDLGAAVERAASAPGVRAIVLAANGTVFSSGHDFSDMVDRDLEGMRRLLRVCADVMLGLARLPIPVVARVQGIATAAGCQLVASCDLAVAVDEASFATSRRRRQTCLISDSDRSSSSRRVPERTRSKDGKMRRSASSRVR